MMFGKEKLEWCRYPTVKKFEDVFIRFDRIHERDRRTDRRTPHDRIGRAYIAIKSVSLALEISLKIATRIDISSFKVVVLVFTRALSEQRGQRTIESALGDNESGRKRSYKSAP